jgi:hypothetical protein
MRHLRRFWNSWQWSVIGAMGGAVGVIGGFALARVSAAVDDPLFDALVLTLPILIGAAILLKRWWPLIILIIGLTHGAIMVLFIGLSEL